MSDIKVPELGEGIEAATVACWHVQKGDHVKADDDIVELVTDKASFNVPADAGGVVTEILVAEGREVEIGKTIAVIDSQA
ncbi:MAG: lipoyl domain-containing protein [Candidatus Omnitrophica bacterium]|nr:lipoyl domain-containing protein [Candidatus Omnitrophota bacterium]